MIRTHHHHLAPISLRRLVVVCLFGAIITVGYAQEKTIEHVGGPLKLRVSPSLCNGSVRPALPASSLPSPNLPHDGIWLPDYARKNPAGHAPLCQLEVRLEKKLPVPLWIRAGKVDALPQFGTGSLYVRMKLLRF